MTTSRVSIKFSPRTGTSGTRGRGRHKRNHAGVLLFLLLLVPLGAHGAVPDREYAERLAIHLSRDLPGLTADGLVLSLQPSCPAEEVELCAVRSTVFGSSTVTLRCKGSNSLPFTAAVNTTLPRPRMRARTSEKLLRAGSKVRLEITSQGFAIFTTATVLSSGALGDTIRVRITRSNRVLNAKVIDSATVRAFPGGPQR